MSTRTQDEGSEDVEDFLRRIKELGDQRDREDAERTRKLEEEILQGRKERQARREERARSLSPMKNSSSNASLSGSTRSKLGNADLLNTERASTLSTLQNQSVQADAAPKQRQSPSVTREPPLTHGNTDILNRPDEILSRNDIARSLQSKSPEWFRQTQDRGAGSAAYRKNLEEDQKSLPSRGSNVGLTGLMSEKQTVHTRTSSPKASSTASVINGSGYQTSIATSTERSPLPTSSNQVLNPPSSSDSSPIEPQSRAYRNGAVKSPFQRNLSPERMERPSSPTKGLGGFVQSAMMKRSDSVNKRWSAQPTARLGRADSISSNRGQYEPAKMAFGGVGSLGEPRPARISRESTPASRPTSSQSDATITPNASREGTSSDTNPARISTAEHDLARRAETPSPEDATRPLSKDGSTQSVTSPPISPSKRWSPQKSSWLEKAINKPDSPKPFTPPPPPQQPSWMADIARAKQQRGSVDLSRSTQHKEVFTGGLMRVPPPALGYKSPSLSGIKGVASTDGRQTENSDDSRLATKKRSEISELQGSKSLGQLPSRETPNSTHQPKASSSLDLKSEQGQNLPAGKKSLDSNIDQPPRHPLNGPLEARTAAAASAPPLSPATKPVIRPKPDFTPPKGDPVDVPKDFQSKGKEGKEEADFRNIFGRLKPTQTLKYKAPDELKDNITRGKAGLVLTGGPQKSERKDDFRDSILKKKEGMVTPSASMRITGSASQMPNKGLPEALQRRQTLKKSESSQIMAPKEQLTSAEVAPKAQAESSTLSRRRSKEDIRASSLKTKDEPKATQVSVSSQDPIISKQIPGAGLGINFASSLSGMLQRGPPKPESQLGSREISEPKALSAEPKSTEKPEPETSSSVPQLTHTTKSRARGPKRKPPAATTNVEEKVPVAPEPAPKPSSSATIIAKPTPKPQSTPERADTRPLQNITNSNNNNRGSSQPPSVRKPSTSVSQSPKFQSVQPPMKSLGRDSPATPPLSSKPRRVADENEPTSAVNRSNEHDPINRGTPKSPTSVPKSPPLPQKPKVLSNLASKSTIPFRSSPKAVGAADHINVAQLLSNVFDEPLSVEGPKIRTPAVLDSASSKDSFPKIKTLRKQILEVTNNGKTTPVPSTQEHFLFEDCLYVCSHVFGTAAGQRMTEIYLWCGDGTSPSALEDAQIFARKYAKEQGGRLIIIEQGKETSSFFQALGGIVITRRGRGPPLAKAQYLLRGRQHIGQVAFDEADFDAGSLCSGFPHIIATGSGNSLYLWKGKGASADEVGCARLIGMDLGEVEEIDEGAEPPAFWSLFQSHPSAMLASRISDSMWHLKAKREDFGLRLFRVEVEQNRPKSASSLLAWGRRGSAQSPERQASSTAQVTEVVPFSAVDLEEGVLVLDAFFETFV